MISKQAFHLSLLQWIPYFGSNNCGQPETYACRSGYGMGFAVGPDMRQRQVDYAALRKLMEQWRRIIPCWYGDYYPLTPYSADADTWVAWQFHLPEQGEGVLHAFRRNGSETEAQTLRLRGLDPDARYRVHNLDRNEPDTIPGKALLETGLTISIPTQPGAVVIHYTISR